MGEEEFREAVTQLELHRAQLEALKRQSEILTIALEEHLRARETMSRYSESSKDDEILVPIGANSFLFAKIADTKKVIVGVGSELAIEDTIENGIKRMDKRIEELRAADTRLAKRMTDLDQKVRECAETVQREYEKLQRGNLSKAEES